MRNKLYYMLYVLYVIMAGFILYINGVFTGKITSLSNLVINGGFLLVIGIIFVISASGFGRLNQCTDALVEVTSRMKKEYEEKGGNIWESYCNRKEIFQDILLDKAFVRYQNRMKENQTGRGSQTGCDLEEYINEDLLDQVGISHFNSAIAGTLTGLGILGTFLGLSIGLGSFEGNDIFTISDNVGPLLGGMKVAFHTSVYGIFFSLVFGFVYRSIMADAYEKLNEFHMAFREYAAPAAPGLAENVSAMLIYQANIAASLKTMTQLQKAEADIQVQGVERIVDQFTSRMTDSLGADFTRLGDSLISACRTQESYAERCQDMEKAAIALLDSNRALERSMEKILERQDGFERELEIQREKLLSTCDNLSSEINNQLYTFEQMRRLYEK